jgi:hypothetical protein
MRGLLDHMFWDDDDKLAPYDPTFRMAKGSFTVTDAEIVGEGRLDAALRSVETPEAKRQHARASLAVEMSIKLRTWFRGDMKLTEAEFAEWLARYDRVD